MTRTRLAELIGVTLNTANQWFGGRKPPTAKQHDALARALHVDRNWLATGAGPMKTATLDAQREEYRRQAVWDFRPAPQDGGRDFGNSNVWSFKPSLEVLVREVAQNSLDAALTADTRVELIFRIIRLAGADKQELLDSLNWPALVRHLKNAAAGGQKLGTQLRDGLDRLESEELLLLVIEDRGTIGLTGPERGTGHFTALCRNNLDSSKDGTKGGAFGLGKAVLWCAARVSTVMFGSHLSEPVDDRSNFRVFGRCELAWHRDEHGEYAGPGWFGRRESQDGTAESFWDNPTLARDLYLDRDGTGTTACVVGFHDPAADRDRSPIELAEELVRAAAVNLFLALEAGRLAVRVEVFDGRRHYENGCPSFTQEVVPDELTPTYARMLRAFRDGTTVDRLGQAGDVAGRLVSLSVPGRVLTPKHAEVDHSAVLLVAAADDGSEAEGLAEQPSHLVVLRGTGMVVEFRSMQGTCLGTHPFYAMLLCGHAPRLAGGQPRPDPAADSVAEQFLRAAEPPSHDKWMATPELKAVYTRGCVARLEQFSQSATEAVRDLVRPVGVDGGDGPRSLKELFRLGPEPIRHDRPRVVEQVGSVDATGRWSVTGRVRIKPMSIPVRLIPAVFFLGETGSGYPVAWDSLEAMTSGCVAEQGSLLLPPGTKEVRFRGATDPRSHPLEAKESCITLEIRKVIPVEESRS
jgi:RNA polymerase primary sigma factor